ncbi:MAG: hypothetical protein CMN54_06505, partial [SAR324 cluster bacterium]|nr:hypothetical protein [SAR324 cluster bacterium]
AWRQGQPGLEFFFSYLMVEIKFPNNNDDSTWELNTRGLDIDALRKAIQREQDIMQQVLQSDSFPWVKFGMETKLVNATEVQEYPYNFADLIFVSLSLPAWVMPPQRPKLLAKLRNILVLYRNNNPDAVIVSITKHAPFRLKDRLSYKWEELSRELGGIGNKGAITRLVAQQLASPSVLKSYLNKEHTTQKISNQTRIQELQNHLESLQYGQTNMRLIVCIENQLHDTYAKRVNAVLRNNKFSKFMVIRESALKPEIMRKCDFMILLGFEASVELKKSKEFQQRQKRIYEIDLEHPQGLPEITARYENMTNKLEKHYLELRESLKEERYSDYFQLIYQKYEIYQDIAANQYEIDQELTKIANASRQLAKGYFNLVELILLIGTGRAHVITRFGGIMLQMTRYLIVDDFSSDIVDHLAKRGYPRHQLTYMSSLDFLQVFLKHKLENPNLANAPTESAYMHFLQNAKFFRQYEVVFINGWNLEENGDLTTKLWTCPVADDENHNPNPTVSSENLHNLLSTTRGKLLRMILPDKDGQLTDKDREKEENILHTIDNAISLTDLTPLAKMMARKKNSTFKANTFLEQETKLLEEMRSDEKFAPEQQLAQNNYGQELSGAITAKHIPSSKPQKTDSSQDEKEETMNPEEELFGSIIRYRLNLVKLHGFACGIRWLSMLENRKVISFLKLQPKVQDMTLWEMLEFGRVCIISEDKPLEEAGIRSALSVGDFPERLVYTRNLPGKHDIDVEAFLLYLIDCESYLADDIVRFLYIKNRSQSASIPVLLLMSENFQKQIQKGEDTLLKHMAGIDPRDDQLNPKGFPISNSIDSLEDVKKVKHIIRGAMGLPLGLYEQFEQKKLGGDSNAEDRSLSAPTSKEVSEEAIQEEMKDMDWSKFPL